MQEWVILVDENDNEIGIAEKMKAHQNGGLLHRAFSVFITNSAGDVLLQQRSATKYHSPLLWTNTCCSHPKPGELTIDAAKRRLFEEMGLKTELNFLFSFIYKVDFDNNLSEYELDHVFWGICDQVPKLNFEEVNDYKYLSIEEIDLDLKYNANMFTQWFKLCWHDVKKKLIWKFDK
jgi:isopentenyl-diphosphate delta-isomerase